MDMYPIFCVESEQMLSKFFVCSEVPNNVMVSILTSKMLRNTFSYAWVNWNNSPKHVRKYFRKAQILWSDESMTMIRMYPTMIRMYPTIHCFVFCQILIRCIIRQFDSFRLTERIKSMNYRPISYVDAICFHSRFNHFLWWALSNFD